MKTIEMNFTAEYASQTELTRIPYGFVNKTVTGCGLTTVALENEFNTIIAVPNVQLILNKVEQYPNNRSNHTILGVLEGVTIEDINNYIQFCDLNNQPVKIMVTYDSLYKLEDMLLNTEIDLVIDESDCILDSTEMKVDSKKNIDSVDVVTKLYEIAYKVKEKVSFISATPIPLEYMPDWIGDLPQIKMNWSNTIKSTAFLRKHSYPTKVLKSEVINPILKDGYFEMKDDKGVSVRARKVIIFLNSVSAIMKTIEDCNLEVDDVALILGDSALNDKRIGEYKRLQNPSELPTFTFVTSTGFQGIDLYDNEAVPVVVSNTSKEYTTIDIATKLKQAISRQRLKTNINYGKYVFIYNNTVLELNESDIRARVKEVENEVAFDCKQYEKFVTAEEKESYKRNYGSNKQFIKYSIYNRNEDSYSVNRNIINYELYNLIEVKKQFEEGFDLRGILGDCVIPSRVKVVLEKTTFKDLVKHFEESEDKQNVDWSYYCDNSKWIELIKDCYEVCGKVYNTPEYCRKNIELAQNPIEQFKAEVYKKFNIGSRYSRKEVKEILQKIYDKDGINRKAKHSDLNEFFETVDKKVRGENYIEILRRK